jgi:proteasome lid subunit RPN8/RPN11
VPPFTLRVPRPLYDAVIAHGRGDLPNEAVGLLAGHPDGRVTARYPLVNALASPRRFESDPASMFAAEKRRRAEGVEFLAVYHSHPTSPPVPSRYDLADHYSAEVMAVIVSFAAEPPEVRAYWLTPTEWRSADMVVEDSAQAGG